MKKFILMPLAITLISIIFAENYHWDSGFDSASVASTLTVRVGQWLESEFYKSGTFEFPSYNTHYKNRTLAPFYYESNGIVNVSVEATCSTLQIPTHLIIENLGLLVNGKHLLPSVTLPNISSASIMADLRVSKDALPGHHVVKFIVKFTPTVQLP